MIRNAASGTDEYETAEPVALISGARLRANYLKLREIAGTDVMAVIKADAYGHGAVPVARRLEKTGCPYFAVARFSEARELREAGIETPILILGRIAPGEAPLAAGLRLDVTLASPDQLYQYPTALRNCREPLSVHIKVDTGMGRLGQFSAQIPDFLRAVRGEPRLKPVGIYTHLATADSADASAARRQCAEFRALIDALSAAGLRPPLAHAANSAGILTMEDARSFEMVRAGIALYGLAPSADCPLPDGIEPLMTFKTRVISVRTFPRGSAIGYGGRYVVSRDYEKIAVIAVGYADGFRRRNGNRVLIQGENLPVVGTVCMDQCMVRVPDRLPVSEGDEAVLIGRQRDAALTADDLARNWETINYEVTSGLTPRVRRIFTDGPETGTGIE